MAFLKFFIGSLYALCVFLPNSLGQDYLPEEVKVFLKGLHDTCVKKVGVPDDINKNYDFSNKSPEAMCYMKCIMIEGGWAGEDEVPFYDKLIDGAHPQIKAYVEHMVNSCRNIPEGTQECERTYNLFACAHQADPEHFYMP
ncbi:hypothetical protein ILUMI_21082 [Ignelater luminosus]|uniref:Uncharacterized protein n=1 Tax=Ignelater luminosus TaxID=2038154 RepID=A0A8K0CF79_IGNLU|nr:hypothetical protein ILUMI_21082 [Ignelater luminosus]